MKASMEMLPAEDERLLPGRGGRMTLEAAMAAGVKRGLSPGEAVRSGGRSRMTRGGGHEDESPSGQDDGEESVHDLPPISHVHWTCQPAPSCAAVEASAAPLLGESWRAASASGPHRVILAFTPVALVHLLAPVASIV